MEDVRKPKIIHYLLVAVILVTAVVSIPSTTAKYSTQKNYRISIETLIPYRYILKANKIADGPGKETNVVSYKAQETGYYVFIIKGGNGAAGMYTNSNALADNASKGGIVYACVYLEKDDVLNAYVGSSATDPKRASSKTNRNDSQPGLNKLNSTAADGGKSSFYDGFGFGLFTYSKNSSGAGGAGTVLLKGSGSSSSLVAVAGGGGGGGGSDDSVAFANYIANVGAKGGDGGNYGSDDTSSSTNFVVYNGEDGGTNSNRGSGGKTTSPLSRSGSTWSNGNGSKGTDFGGGGGGGYAGGGGGKGTGAGSPAGGGGGGSSCIVKKLNEKDTLGLKAAELSKVYELVNNSGYSATQREGFVIIAYIENGMADSAKAAYSTNAIS